MKKNKEAQRLLRIAYGALAKAINATADLELLFHKSRDKRARIAARTFKFIGNAQGALNPLAEHEDL